MAAQTLTLLSLPCEIPSMPMTFKPISVEISSETILHLK